MDLYRALHGRVSAYLSGKIPLLDLREWVERHDPDVAASDNEALRALDADVWELLSEMDLGERTELEVRSGLGARYPALVPDTEPHRFTTVMVACQVAPARRLIGILDLSAPNNNGVWVPKHSTLASHPSHLLSGSFAT